MGRTSLSYGPNNRDALEKIRYDLQRAEKCSILLDPTTVVPAVGVISRRKDSRPTESKEMTSVIPPDSVVATQLAAGALAFGYDRDSGLAGARWVRGAYPLRSDRPDFAVLDG